MGNEENCPSPQVNPAGETPAPIYEIRVKGCRDKDFWCDWFGGMEFSMDADQDETILRGPLADQAELYGLLSRLRNTGLTLISIQKVRSDPKAKDD